MQTQNDRPTALVMPVEGPLEQIVLDGSLEQLQRLVGGYIEAVPIPHFVKDAARATAYINEDGKVTGLPANMRATDFMVPGVNLYPGDYIAGPMILLGFDPETGEHAELPLGVAQRAKLIEREAGQPKESADQAGATSTTEGGAA